MAHWHELTRIRGVLARYSKNNQAKQSISRSLENPEIFEAHFERKESEERTEYPDGWVQLWPIEPITASTPQEAADKALSLLEVVADKSREELLEQRDFPIPIRRKKVREVQSSTHRASAWLIKHSETRYEVRYFGDVVGSDEEGWLLSISEVEGMPVPLGFQMFTLADSLQDAEQIAISELERIVSNGDIKNQ